MKKFIAFTTGAAMLATAFPAFAAGNISIITTNDARVRNEVNAISSTGFNVASGSVAASDTSGGNIDNVGGANTTGNGGNKVMGGSGGLIQTGDAFAAIDVKNTVNELDAGATGTAWAVADIYVDTSNLGRVRNLLLAEAYTDGNEASGSVAGATTEGGNVTHAEGLNKAGNGGNTVDAGANGGGAIVTGNARTEIGSVNIVNRTMVRVQK